MCPIWAQINSTTPKYPDTKKSKNIRIWKPPFVPQFSTKEVFFMSYQQLHAGKIKLNGLAGIRHHLLDRQRVKTNPDIDLERSQLNHSIENLSPENLINNVRQRIKQLHLKRKPRTDAVGLEDIIVGASADFMLQLSSEKREQYFADALHFFQHHYGKENVVYCHCHFDESNPHTHIGIIPITPDGRLSARDVFNPKSLEKLQTDFHREVSQLYGLERGEHHSRNYLELNQFKAQRAKQELIQYTHDLNSARLTQNNIDKIYSNAHYSSSGFIFKSEDKNNTELPTTDFNELHQISQDGAKAMALNLLLLEQNQQLQREKDIDQSNCNFLQHRLNELEKETALYTAVPPLWREHVDSSINNWQETFTNYCHDVNRATIRVFLATHGNYKQTENIMHDFIKKTGIDNVHKYISNVIHDAILQHKENFQPTAQPPSWKTPKPNNTDYTKPDELGVVPLQLSRVPDIDWDLINWELLSELEKDEIRNKIEVYSR